MRLSYLALATILLSAAAGAAAPPLSPSCVSSGDLQPGERVDAVADVPAATLGFGVSSSSTYRLVVEAPGIVRVHASTDWPLELVVRADCEDPASVVMTSGMQWEGEADAWRALDAGAYWIEVRAEADPPGTFTLEAAYIETPTPALPRWLPSHAHPGEIARIDDVRGVNRDSTFRLGERALPLRASRDTTGEQYLFLAIPADLADGEYAFTASNGERTATSCCVKVVPHVHPKFQSRILDVTPPENGIGYRWDERAPLVVEVVNEGNGPGSSRVCMFIGFPGGGGWSYPCYDYGPLAPGASTVIPVGVDLGGYVGDMRVIATNGGPQLIALTPGAPLRENEVVLPALVGGVGTGFFVPGFVD